MAATRFNLADLFEQAADAWPGRPYLTAAGVKRTYGEMDARANQLAHHLAQQGIGPGDHVGIYGLNSVQWVEALWALFKLRAVWININYRYVEDELAYLFDNADLKYLLVDPEWADRSASVAPTLPRLVFGAEYEAALSAQSPSRHFAPRSNDDIYILFTGGTTGMPKGVVWRHEDVLMALGGGIDIRTSERITSPDEFIAKGNGPMQMTYMPLAPLMHGATQWGVMGQSFTGNHIVLVPKFDPAEIWKLVGTEKVNSMFITGDAMGRPLLDEYDRAAAAGTPYETSSMFSLSSSAVLFSQSLKDEYLDRFPNLFITDSIGSSEGGANGMTMVTKGQVMKGGPTVTATRDAVVLHEETLQILGPGDGRGKLARRGNIPLRYHKDPEKTAATFITAADGIRYVIPGDYAQIEHDGAITLLGRGSVSINSGGEKIFPEEVEAAVVSHPDVYDATVVGVPDERWGERVAVVVRARDGQSPTLESLQEHCRTKIAGYKIPREIHLVDEIQRSPSGKPDYRWAKRVALGEL
jgi:3-oxocholest-4-en-26-oate---CoA ligase